MQKQWIALLFIVTLLLNGCLSQRKIARYRASEETSQSEKVISLDAIRITPKRNDDFRTIPTKLIDILHTDLAVSFNWGKHECIGKAVMLIKPYFYETDSIVLDAKNMIFSEITLTDNDNNQIQYLSSYDKKKLRLKLEKKLNATDTISLQIKYIAKPDEQESGNGKSIKDEKGLYFINTNNKEPFKPIQLWTQGETESNSCWFPTIDQVNEKFTFKIAITANKDLTTLSNGKFIGSDINGILKTDVWEMNQPIPAYLVSIAVGNFVITKDQLTTTSTESVETISYDTLRVPLNDTSKIFKDSVVVTKKLTSKQKINDLLNGVEVSYYLEPSFSPYAKNIFKHTPEMIHFFSAKLGVDYPWGKYAQVVVHDFVAGAMENTSATTHNYFVQKNNRELIDAPNDDIIAHELFHQWFGDLVTCKSWSHLVLNEGFATYGEQLWLEYKYGQDASLVESYNTLNRYLNYSTSNNDDPIVQFNYKDADDMFNVITYQKGALVYQLLRSIVGDDAFFLALKNYLQKYAYLNAEIDDLRNEFELITGKDLRPFFNQWFLKGGHPIIELRYDYNDSTKLLAVNVEQKQTPEIGLFKFPLKFKVTQGGQTKYFTFDIAKRSETFYVQKFDAESSEQPNVFVDPDATFIGELKDNKSFINHIKTYNNAANFIEKIRSLRELSNIQATVDTARNLLLTAVNDIVPEIRVKALDWINWNDFRNVTLLKSHIIDMAKSDPSVAVRAKAISVMSNWKDAALFNTFVELSNDSSYNISAASLKAIYLLLPDEAVRISATLEKDARRNLLQQISTIYANAGKENNALFYEQNLMKHFGYNRAVLINDYADFCNRLNIASITSQAITTLTDRAYNDENANIRTNAISALNTICKKLIGDAEAIKDVALRKEKFTEADSFKENIQRIIDQEKDKEVISSLKLVGLTQTQEVNENK